MRTALVTPSYAGDFARCELLCETMDRFVTGRGEHLILVDGEDAARFRALEGPGRRVVDERDILPVRLRTVRPFGGRKAWLEPGLRALRLPPLRGWHVQQLRRIAIAQHVDVDALLYCDSDMLFVRPFDVRALWRDGDLRLYRVPGGIHEGLPKDGREHLAWTRHAYALNGLPPPDFPANDYINNLVSWRRDHVTAMCAGIEERFGTDWASAVVRSRTFSECQIYGAYADGGRGGAGHWHAAQGLARTYWSGDRLDEGAARAFVEGLDEGQVAVGVQSFTGTDPVLLRRAIGSSSP